MLPSQKPSTIDSWLQYHYSLMIHKHENMCFNTLCWISYHILKLNYIPHFFLDNQIKHAICHQNVLVFYDTFFLIIHKIHILKCIKINQVFYSCTNTRSVTMKRHLKIPTTILQACILLLSEWANRMHTGNCYDNIYTVICSWWVVKQ